MKIMKTVMSASMSAAALGLMGCNTHVAGDSQHHSGYPQQQPAYAEPPPQYFLVQQAPPPARIEYRPSAPSGSYVWIDGYWNWDNQRYNWQPGRYVVPPQSDVVWVAPRCEADGRNYRYTPGQWIRQPVYVEQQPQYILVQQAPPPARVEYRPAAPSASYVWIDGYWNWDNQRYNWQAGQYVVPPQPDVVWIAPRYEADGRNYRYTPGQWARQNQGNGHGRG